MATINLREETIINGVINNGVVIPNETDPTVPAHVKAITEEDITKWNKGAVVDTSNFYSKEEIDQKGYITEEQVDNKGFLTETSLDEFATKEELNNKSDITHSHSEYITETILNEKGYLTQEDISGLDIDINLENYYTKTEIDNKNYLTSVPSEYVTETELNNKKYVTETTLNNKHYVTESSLVDFYPTRSYLQGNYYSKTEIDNKNYLTSVPSEYVTETELNNKGYLTQEDIGDIDVDLTDYYTKSDIDNKNYQTEENVDELIGYALENRMGILSESVESPYYFYDSFYSDPLKNLKAGAYYTNGSFKLSFEAPNTSSVPNETTLFEKNSVVYINIFKNGSTYYYLITDITGLAYDITIADGTITEVIKIEPATKDYVDNLFNSITNGDEVSY